MKNLILLVSIFLATTIAHARSIAPASSTLEFEGQVEAKIEKEVGVTCMAIGCPPAPVFLSLKLLVLDTNSKLKVIDTHLEQDLTVDTQDVYFELDGQKIYDGDQFVLNAKLQLYSFIEDYASIEKVNSVVFLTDTQSFDFSQDIMVSCQDQSSDMAFTIIVEDQKARVWMKDAVDTKNFPVKGQTQVIKLRNKTTRINLKAQLEKVDWDNEQTCWKHNKYPNLSFFFDANGNASVDFYKTVLTDPAAFCVMPMFMPNPKLDLDCVQL